MSATYTLGEYKTTIRFLSKDEALKPIQKDPLYITDDHVSKALDLSGLGSRLVTMPAGEEAKAWPQVESVILKGFELGLARDDWFFGVGGGVVCDMAAFAASLYLRGCKLVLVPTTLLAMVDAAFGGKTGINFGGLKNMVGTFYPATELRICPEFVNTLPEREYLSGIAEVIKSAALMDSDLWAMLKSKKSHILSREPKAVAEMIERSLLVKAKIVEADFKEENIRAYLNLGHTFAHALEASAGFGVWTHGEAVAWGMVKALQLSKDLGYCDEPYAAEMRSMVEAFGFRTKCEIDPLQLLAAMKLDKKKKDGAVRFVLQKSLCDTFKEAVADEAVLKVLNQG